MAHSCEGVFSLAPAAMFVSVMCFMRLLWVSFTYLAVCTHTGGTNSPPRTLCVDFAFLQRSCMLGRVASRVELHPYMVRLQYRALATITRRIMCTID